MTVLCESLDLAPNGLQIRDQYVLFTICCEFLVAERLLRPRDGVEDVDDVRHRRLLGLGDKPTSDS